MKNFGFSLAILLMAALNWSVSLRKVYPESHNTEATTATVFSMSVVIGLALMALLLNLLYRCFREILDRGVVTYPRFRIPASFRLFPRPYAYSLLMLFVLGMTRSGVSPGSDARGSFQSTLEWSFGSQCSLTPLLLAAVCITLWNILLGVTMEPPSGELPTGLVSHKA